MALDVAERVNDQAVADEFEVGFQDLGPEQGDGAHACLASAAIRRSAGRTSPIAAGSASRRPIAK